MQTLSRHRKEGDNGFNRPSPVHKQDLLLSRFNGPSSHLITIQRANLRTPADPKASHSVMPRTTTTSTPSMTVDLPAGRVSFHFPNPRLSQSNRDLDSREVSLDNHAPLARDAHGVHPRPQGPSARDHRRQNNGQRGARRWRLAHRSVRQA